MDVEISIKTYKYEIFGRYIYVFLQEDQKEFIDIFFKSLNDKLPIEEAKEKMINFYGEKRLPRFPPSVYSNDWIIRNIGLGDVIEKIEEFYKVELRNIKISDLTKD